MMFLFLCQPIIITNTEKNRNGGNAIVLNFHSNHLLYSTVLEKNFNLCHLRQWVIFPPSSTILLLPLFVPVSVSSSSAVGSSGKFFSLPLLIES